MSFPAAPPAVPPVVRRLAAGRPVQAVWANELGGVTFRVGPGAEFIKVARTGVFDFTAEAQRLRWASAHLTVPAVLDFGVEQDWAWLRTAGLPGVSAVHPRWVAAPDVAVRAIGVGLRTLHERLPVRACPFDWSAQSRLARLTAAGRANVGAPPPDRSVGGLPRRRVCTPHPDRRGRQLLRPRRPRHAGRGRSMGRPGGSNVVVAVELSRPRLGGEVLRRLRSGAGPAANRLLPAAVGAEDLDSS